MHNFHSQKALKSCSPAELSVGTCFELLVGSVPVRRGVVCFTEPSIRVWFVLKSSSADDLYPIDAGLTVEECASLQIRGVPMYDDFVKSKVPAKVRARGLERPKGQKRKFVDNDDMRMHPDLQNGVVSPRPISSFRIQTNLPLCSPPASPKASARQKAQTPTTKAPTPLQRSVIRLNSDMQDLDANVRSMADEFNKLRRSVKKLAKRIKKQGARAKDDLSGGVLVDWC